MTYFNHFISSFEDELLLYPYGMLDTEYDDGDDEIEEVEEIKFGQEELDKILSNEYGRDNNGWVTEQEYEAERLENIEYERIAHDYQVLLRKKKENEEKGIYLHDDEYSEDEYIDIGHGKNY